MPAPAGAAAMQDAGTALAMEVLDRFGEVRLRVTGTSMVPSVWPGDVVTVRRCLLHHVETGQIVLATRDGRLFVHRALALQPACLLTQGDALAWPDPPVFAHQLLGRVESIDRRGTRVDLPTFTAARRAVAAIVRRSTAAGRLLGVGDRLRRLATRSYLTNQQTCGASERASEPRERSAPAPRRARERVGESERRQPLA
jgi:hypothetical protein